MSFLSADMLSQMRADVANMLPDTAVIQTFGTVAQSSDGFAGGTYTATGTVVCRLDPLGKNAAVRLALEREVTAYTYQLTVPYDTALVHNARVVVNSNTYEVIQLDVDHSWNVSKRAIVERLG